MVTFNFTLRSTFFTGANRIIFSALDIKILGGGGLSPLSEILGHSPPVPSPFEFLIWEIHLVYTKAIQERSFC